MASGSAEPHETLPDGVPSVRLHIKERLLRHRWGRTRSIVKPREYIGPMSRPSLWSPLRYCIDGTSRASVCRLQSPYRLAHLGLHPDGKRVAEQHPPPGREPSGLVLFSTIRRFRRQLPQIWRLPHTRRREYPEIWTMQKQESVHRRRRRYGLS